MIATPPKSTLSDTVFPHTALFLSTNLAALSEPALVAPANLSDVHPGVSVRPLYRQPNAILGRLVTGRLDRPRLLVCPLQGRRHPREGRRPCRGLRRGLLDVAFLTMRRPEIGRASCRERWCQYV